MTPARKKRIQLDFTLPESNHLDDLVERTGHRTRADVIRRSLNLYDTVVKAIQSGGTLIVEDREGKRHRLTFYP